MTEPRGVEYLGFVVVGDKNPLLALASEDGQEGLRKRHGRDGVIFTEAEDMPSLEALLEAQKVSYAVLESPAPLADQAVVAAPSRSEIGWREDARRRLERATDDRERSDVVFYEDYAFIPALPSDDLDTFLESAHTLLNDYEVTARDWEDFLLNSARSVAAADRSQLKPLELAAGEGDEPEPLFTSADLVLSRRRGALGAPPPLAPN